MKTQSVDCLLMTMQELIQHKIEFKIVFSEGTLLTHVRNSLLESAMSNKDITHFLFVDSDMTYDPSWITEMIKSDLPIVTGVAKCRGRELLNIFRFVASKNLYQAIPEEELSNESIVIDSVGMSFIMIKREVLEKLQQTRAQLNTYLKIKMEEASNSEMRRYFKELSDDKGFFRAIGLKSEDILFCEDMRNAGYDIICKTKYKTGHIVEKKLTI